MNHVASTRPASSEYAPYYGRYVSLAPAGNLIDILSRQLQESLVLLRDIPESRADFRYAADKWSIKELLGHICDTERIFCYRALRFARGDATPLPGMEQDDYVRHAGFDRLRWNDLVEEFASVRKATVWFFRQLDDEAWLRRGVANEREVSVRALACIIAGHQAHHLGVLRTRYLNLKA